MTKQEIYDKVCAHLAKQKAKAMKGNSCVYRAEDGKRCAVGCLIPYNVWKKEIGYDRNSDSLKTLLFESRTIHKMFGRNERILKSLQSVHDSSTGKAATLRESLIRVAKEFRIKPGAEQKIKVWNP